MLEDKLLAVSVSFSKWLACNYTTDQLNLLSAFFNSVSDNLGIIASARELCDSNGSNQSADSK